MSYPVLRPRTATTSKYYGADSHEWMMHVYTRLSTKFLYFLLVRSTEYSVLSQINILVQVVITVPWALTSNHFRLKCLPGAPKIYTEGWSNLGKKVAAGDGCI